MYETKILFNTVFALRVCVLERQNEVNTYKTVFLINNDIELIIVVKDVDVICQSEYYLYGVVFDVYSKSLSNKNYTTTFNAYFYSSLGKGQNIYDGAYTVSNVKPQLASLVANNNGKKVNKPFPMLCQNLRLAIIGLEKIKIDYWGTVGGIAEGIFLTSLN